MPHTASRYQQDLGFTDARLMAAPGDLAFVASGGTLALSNVGAGDWSINAANSTTGKIACNVTSVLLRRLGFFEDIQSAFGSTFGSGLGGVAAGPAGTPGTGIPGSAAPQGRPDTIAAMSALQEITPRSTLKIKGIKLNSFDVIYTVSSADATTLNCRVDSIQYTNGAAVPAATAVLASGANGLIKTQSANAYVINVAIPTPTYLTLADFVEWIELDIATPGGGTFDLRGFDLLVEFNFN